MKRFVGKVWYFVNAWVSDVADFLGEHHIISEKTMEKAAFKVLSNMEVAVLGLMKQENYRRFRSGPCNK